MRRGPNRSTVAFTADVGSQRQAIFYDGASLRVLGGATGNIMGKSGDTVVWQGDDYRLYIANVPEPGKMMLVCSAVLVQLRPRFRRTLDETCEERARNFCNKDFGKTDALEAERAEILRVGYFTSRRAGTGAFNANMIVFANPDLPVSQLRRWMKN